MKRKQKSDISSLVILLFFGLAIGGVSLVVLWAYPVSILTCSHVEKGRVDCRTEDRMIGLIPLREETLTDLKDAYVISEKHEKIFTKREIIDNKVYKLVLASAESEVTLGSFDEFGGLLVGQVVDRIKDYLQNPTEEPLQLWQATWIPLVLGGLFLLLALVMLYSVVDSLIRDLVRKD